MESFLLLSAALAPLYRAAGLGDVYAGKWPYFGSQGGWTLLKGFWDVSSRFPGVGGTSELKQSLAFVALMTTVGTVLSLPKEWYKTFVLEEKHGFNKTTRGGVPCCFLFRRSVLADLSPPSLERRTRTGTFLADQVKGYFLSLALELPILAGVLKIIAYFGSEGVLRIVTWLMVFM